jgi:hypothetical protein
MRQRSESDHSPPSNAEVNKGGAIAPLPRLSSWHSAYLIKQRDNFTFYALNFRLVCVAIENNETLILSTYSFSIHISSIWTSVSLQWIVACECKVCVLQRKELMAVVIKGSNLRHLLITDCPIPFLHDLDFYFLRAIWIEGVLARHVQFFPNSAPVKRALYRFEYRIDCLTMRCNYIHGVPQSRYSLLNIKNWKRAKLSL